MPAVNIKVLLIDDSLFFREALTQFLSKDKDITIIGTAANCAEAIKKIEELRPDVITLDIEMPGMSGIEFLKDIMPRYAIPTIVVSSDGTKVLDALGAGALDFVTKPNRSIQMNNDVFINELRVKVKVASTANRSVIKSKNSNNDKLKEISKRTLMIAIGASTGGTEAIFDVVKDLPQNIPPIVVVQHMPPVFTRMYADRLNARCKFIAKEAEDGDEIKPGRLLLAPGDFQMKIRKAGTSYYVECKKAEKVSGHCPSVDVLFTSIADKPICKNTIGIILTGMGADGAKGLLEMSKKGAYTLGQNEATSVVYGMPCVANELGAVRKQLSLTGITQEILNMIKE